MVSEDASSAGVCSTPPSRETRVVRRGVSVRVVLPDGNEWSACYRFLERLQIRGLSVHTVQAYAFDLALIRRWLDAVGLELEQLSAQRVHEFLAWERGRDSHPRSMNRRLHTLRLFYAFVVGQPLPGGVVHRDHLRPWHRDRELGVQTLVRSRVSQLRVKVPRTLVEPLSIEQVRELLALLRRYRDLAIAHFMLLCGLRSQEVLLLRLTDVDFVDRRVRVRGKGDKERLVPLPTLLIRIVCKYLGLERPRTEAEHLFVILQGKGRGQGMTSAGLRRVFRTRRSEALLAKANPHRLRHTFGTDMARSGVRLPILQRMMGHAYPETTLQYVNVSMADIATEFHRAVAKLIERYGGDWEDAE
jgi:integrase/recombinase XerC